MYLHLGQEHGYCEWHNWTDYNMFHVILHYKRVPIRLFDTNGSDSNSPTWWDIP